MEYVHAIKLPAQYAMTEIIRKIYVDINNTENNIEPIEINCVPCNGVGSRCYFYSLSFFPNTWQPGIHDAEITFFDKNSKEKLVNFRIRFETNIHEIYIYCSWEEYEWLPIIKDALDSFFLDYRITASIRADIKTT